MSLKTSPLPANQAGRPGQSLTSGTQNSEARTRAISIARGENPAINVTSADPALDAAVAAELLKDQPKPIRRRTNFTTPAQPDPSFPQAQQEAPIETPTVSHEDLQNVAQPTPTVPERPVGSQDEQAKVSTQGTQTAAEETKPLSPQFAALQRQRRALQVKEREIQAREKALSEAAAQPKGPTAEEIRARLKQEPLSVLQEAGVTYDQLTEAILADKSGLNPELFKLREEIKALKEGFDKNLSDRDAQAETAALAEMQREASRLAQSDPNFELVQATGSVPEVVDLIKRTWKETGEVMDVREAMQLVEDFRVTETLERAKTKKLQSKLAPKPTAPAVAPKAPQQPQAPAMRTLTNRDTSTVPLTRKERAMQAFHGQLKK